MDYGKKIIELRELKGWTQYRLYKETGISQANLSRFENGLITPGADMLQKICTTLGVSMAEFDDNLAQRAINLGDNLDLSDERKAALESLKGMTPEEQTRRLVNMYEKLKNLPLDQQKALESIINHLSSLK